MRAALALALLLLAVPAAAYEIRPARIYRMATDTRPADNVQEDGISTSRYYRAQYEHAGPGLVRVQWLLHDGTSGAVPASKMPDITQLRVRCLVDNVPVSDWMPGPGTCELAAVMPTLRDGHHGLSLDVVWPGQSAVVVSAVLFTKGPPLGAGVAQTLAVCPNGYDYAYASVRSDKCAEVDWPGKPPTIDVEPWNRVSKARPYGDFPTDLTKFRNAWWIECVGICTHRMLIRRPVEGSPNRDGAGMAGAGRMMTGGLQQYYYEDSTAQGKSTLAPVGSTHRVPQIDGPRGIGTTGSVVSIRFWAPTGDAWFLSTGARLAKLQLRGPGAGTITTTFGLRQKPGPVGYWAEPGSQMFESHYEHVGMWVGPHLKPPQPLDQMVEPWDFVFLDPPTPGTTPHHFLVTNTKSNLSATGGSLVYVDHTPTHLSPPQPPVARDVVVFQPGQCDWPWGITTHRSGWIYVACQLSHTIMRVKPVTPGVWDGPWIAEVAWRSAKSVTREALGVDTACRGCNHRATSMTATQIRAAYHANGLPGVGSMVFPQAIREDSQGFLIVGSRYGFEVAEFNPETWEKRAIFAQKAYPEAGGGDWRDVQLDVNNHGGAGPLDMIRMTGWAQAVSNAWTRQGGYLFQLWPDAAVRVLTTGQFAGADQIQYPWAVATNQDGEEIFCGTGDQQQCFVRRRIQSTDVPVDTSRYAHGLDVWLRGGTGNPKHASFALTNGQHGYGEFGLPTIDTMGRMSDEALGAFIQAGAGTKEPRPDITGTALSDLIYWIRANAKTTPAPPPTLYPLVLTASGSGTVDGSGQYPAGQTVPIVATPDDGWEFLGWSPPCDQRPFAMPAGATACSATFQEIPPLTITCDAAGACRTSRVPPAAFTATCPARLPDGSSCVVDTTP